MCTVIRSSRPRYVVINHGWKFFVLFSIITLAITFHMADQYQTFLHIVKSFKFSPYGVHDKMSTSPKIHLAISVCGPRLEEAIVLTKSLAMTATTPVVLHAFLEKQLQAPFKNATNAWPTHLFRNTEIDVRDMFWPTRVIRGIPEEYWKTTYKSCAFQRLFIPEVFPDLDRVIYVDSDMLFLAPVKELWDMKSQFNTQQIIGVTPENHPGGYSYYEIKRKQPFYGKLGLNSGVILYDLNKLNKTQYLVDIRNISTVWKGMIDLQDQGILNIMFHFFPEKVYELPCEWNFRDDFCPKQTCPGAEKQGARLVHGNRHVFHNNDGPVFKAVYNAFRDVPKENMTVKSVISKLEETFKSVPAIQHKKCGTNLDKYFVHLRRLTEG